ncbi:MAG: flavodoxin domain-containing protein [Actinomycetota bacterium]
MRASVVFESLYGNTASVARAIAASLSERGMAAEAMPVDQLDPASTDGIELLIVGGPTHVHGMSRASTRRAGVNDEKGPHTFAEPTVETGVREWLERLPDGAGRRAAAFDTRIDKAAWLTGSAAKGIAKRLEANGFRLALDPESFFVTTENALADGELEHAARWGATLANEVATATG